MTTMTQHAAGMFCWCQLSTSDPEGAKKFYPALFGWDFEDISVGGQGLTLLKKGGKVAGALCGLPKQQREQGIAPSWMSFVAVENADQTAAKVKQSGGKMVMEPFDVIDNGTENGRMAVCEDPTRAVFSLWQAKKQIGAGVVNEIGSMCWNELITTDARKAGSFYESVFGWKPEPMPMPGDVGRTYTIFKHDATQVGGMMTATPEMHLTHPYWMIYFAVDDCDKTAAKAEELGGKIMMKPTDIPTIGRFAVIRDPQGAWFSILKPMPQA